MTKILLVFLLVVLVCVTAQMNYYSYHGRGNNIEFPGLGAANTKLKRVSPNTYKDGISVPTGGIPSELASAREISNVIYGRDAGGGFNMRMAATDLTTFWGQFLDHDISLTPNASPCESFPIPIKNGDSHFNLDGTGRSALPFCRSLYADGETVREQVNVISAFIDGGMIYGSSNQVNQKLRTLSGGLMKVTNINGEDYPVINDDGTGKDLTEMDNAAKRVSTHELHAAGDVRANENPVLFSLHTLFVREHNRLAKLIGEKNNTLSDEEIFQAARKMVIAFLQQITYEEYIPTVIGRKIEQYKGYNSQVDPAVRSFFSTVTFRQGHDAVNSIILRLGPDWLPVMPHGNTLLRDAYFFPSAVTDVGVSAIFRGAMFNVQSAIDAKIVDDVRHFLFASHPNLALDLAAFNIQRARDHGIATYNDAREAYGLPRCKNYSCINEDPEVTRILTQLYGENGIDKADAYVGLLEKPLVESNLGMLFQLSFIEQFAAIRDGDRFFYLNPGVLTSEQLAEVRNTTLGDIIKRNTDVTVLSSENVFLRKTKNKFQSCPAIPKEPPAPVTINFFFKDLIQN